MVKIFFENSNTKVKMYVFLFLITKLHSFFIIIQYVILAIGQSRPEFL